LLRYCLSGWIKISALKKLITITILLSYCLVSYGQSKEIVRAELNSDSTGYLFIDSSGKVVAESGKGNYGWGDGVVITNEREGKIFLELVEYDTIPVLLLYSDTSVSVGQKMYGQRNYSCQFSFGYMVFKKNREVWEGAEWDEPTQYLHLDKKPFKKSTVIWQVKYLNKKD